MEYLTSYHHDISIFPATACLVKIKNHLLGNFSKFVELKRGQERWGELGDVFLLIPPVWSPTVRRQCFSDWITLIRTATRNHRDPAILSICLFVCLFSSEWSGENGRQCRVVRCGAVCEGGRSRLTNINFQQAEYKWWSGPTPGQGRGSPLTLLIIIIVLTLQPPNLVN